MSELSKEQRLRVLAALVDGNSERATERMTGASRLTIRRFALRLGAGAQHLHNLIARDLSVSLIEHDEVWGYVRKKQARVSPEEHAAGFGDAMTFVALGMPSRFVVTWKVGKRDEATASAYLADCRARVVVMPAMTSDGLAAYVAPMAKHFPGVDYAQVIKNYRKSGRKDDDHRYEPPREPFLTKKAILGAPNVGAATTAHVERNHGTMRHHIGRMRRLVYAFSKSPEHHTAAVALNYVHYNLCWIPRTTRVTPALAVGATDHLWELEELLDALLSVPETAPPQAQPLTPRKPETTSRELPNGRGFLRVVGSSGPAAPTPSPATPPPAPAGSEALPTTEHAERHTSGQLDLFSWKPRPRKPVQLSLFGEPDTE